MHTHLYVHCLFTPSFSISSHLVNRFTTYSLQFADIVCDSLELM